MQMSCVLKFFFYYRWHIFNMTASTRTVHYAYCVYLPTHRMPYDEMNAFLFISKLTLLKQGDRSNTQDVYSTIPD